MRWSWVGPGPQSTYPADDLGQHLQCQGSLLGHLAAGQMEQLLERVPCSLVQGQKVKRNQDTGQCPPNTRKMSRKRQHKSVISSSSHSPWSLKLIKNTGHAHSNGGIKQTGMQ